MYQIRQRRLLGLLLGLGLGLTYGLVSQLINRVFLPGVPLYQPPFGPAVNIIISVLLGGLLGLIAAWSEHSVESTLAAIGAAGIIIVIAIVLTSRPDAQMLPGRLIIFAFLYLPICAAVTPLLAFFRWGLNRNEQESRSPVYAPRRIWPLLALFVVFAFLGRFFLYTPDARDVIGRMNTLVQAGLTASSPSNLPAALQVEGVGGFSQKAGGGYTLQWDKSHLPSFGIPHPGQNENLQSVVIARFDNQWSLVCLFVPGEAEPRCKGFDELPYLD